MGRVSQTVQVLKQTKKATKQDDKKPLSYAEVAKRGVSTRTPIAPRAVVAWSATRTFFLRPEDESVRSKEIPVWVFGARLRQKFGPIPEGGDPPLLHLHRIARDK